MASKKKNTKNSKNNRKTAAKKKRNKGNNKSKKNRIFLFLGGICLLLTMVFGIYYIGKQPDQSFSSFWEGKFSYIAQHGDEVRKNPFVSMILEETEDLIGDVKDGADDLAKTFQKYWYRIRYYLNRGDSDDRFSVESVPEYEGSPYAVINENIPFFKSEEITTECYEYYSELDSLGRCGVTMACIGQEIMPVEERGAIGMIKPSGWKLKKYSIVDGNYLYNRCHLIGYQLTGENANEKNLITGTRYLNVTGMLPFENETADYIEETGNHVMYRVTPIFEGSNLVASGVLMEAWSVEDCGVGLCFCVYIYNIQPGVTIQYATGDSWLTP